MRLRARCNVPSHSCSRSVVFLSRNIKRGGGLQRGVPEVEQRQVHHETVDGLLPRKRHGLCTRNLSAVAQDLRLDVPRHSGEHILEDRGHAEFEGTGEQHDVEELACTLRHRLVGQEAGVPVGQEGGGPASRELVKAFGGLQVIEVVLVDPGLQIGDAVP